MAPIIVFASESKLSLQSFLSQGIRETNFLSANFIEERKNSMKQLFRKYRALTFEEKIVFKTVIGLCFSAALALGKLFIGIFTDYNLVSIAVYTFGILLAKLECLLGVNKEAKTFRRRNAWTAFFLLFSSLVYIGFMSRMFFIERKLKNNGMIYVLLLAFISFCELGFAIAGLFRTKNKGHSYRNIKIVNFCVALIAILTTQMAILNQQSQTGIASIYNAYTGIGVGCFIALCAVYILIAPKTSYIGREHHAFLLIDPSQNNLIDMNKDNAEIVLCKSFVYGDFFFRGKIQNETLEGEIVRGKSLWKRMHVLFKILCCILSEILIFVWLIGRGLLFFRSIDLPDRLSRKMRQNGFEER